MNLRHEKSVIEGLLFMAGDEGLSAKQIAEIIERPAGIVYEMIESMRKEFLEQQRGLQIMEIAGTFQFATLAEHAVYYEKLAHTPNRASLSQAALETLSIIAYQQPITRVEIEEVRGVKSERAIQTLTQKGLIYETGRAEVIGRPILYGTTKSFLEYFGLQGLDQLPEAAALEEITEEYLFENFEELRTLYQKKQGTE